MGPLLLAVLLSLQDTPVVLRDVTLIDVEAATVDEARRSGMTVVLRGDQIVAVGPAAEVELPPHARVIDGTGKFLIPGLFDMHTHLAGQGDGALITMVVHGVTSARDLGGDLELLDASLARVAEGELAGPRVARAGFVLEERGWLERVIQMYADGAGDPEYMRKTRIGLATEDDVLAAVGRVADSGAEILKFRNTPNAALFRFLMEEAQLAGLRVAGHEPNTIDLLEAVSLGMGSLEHTPVRAILGGTTDERWREIFAAMIGHDVHVTPTFTAMVGRKMTADELAAALAAERDDPRFATLTPETVAAWDQGVAERRSESNDLDWKDIAAQGEALARDMRAAGVSFLAGTDLGVPFVYAGSSLHEEVALLVELAGLGPLEALQAATSNAAGWLGWERLGAIRAGYGADLVLLDGDPLADVANVGRIHTVVSRGRVYGPERRAQMMAEVSAATSAR